MPSVEGRRDQSPHLSATGCTEADVRKQVDLRQWKKLKHFDEQMGGNINKVWLEVEAENF